MSRAQVNAPWRLILNPHAGSGRTRRRCAALVRGLRALGVTVEVVETRHPRHATALARAAVADGVVRLVAVGGDGPHAGLDGRAAAVGAGRRERTPLRWRNARGSARPGGRRAVRRARSAGGALRGAPHRRAAVWRPLPALPPRRGRAGGARRGDDGDPLPGRGGRRPGGDHTGDLHGPPGPAARAPPSGAGPTAGPEYGGGWMAPVTWTRR